MKWYNNFITKSEFKTPPMTVSVIDKNGKVSYNYAVPAGFQLERYVMSLYPDATLMTHMSMNELTVSVVLDGSVNIYEIHRGISQLN